MPRLDDSMQSYKIGGSFAFSGTRVERLGAVASEYTLVDIAVDVSGSVLCFAKQLREMLISAIEGCKKGPRAENVLLRVIFFSSKYPNGINEIHGYKPLNEIDLNSYPDIQPGGETPLYDACYSVIGAQNVYAKKLAEPGQDFSSNGIAYIITDGGENASIATAQMVADEARKSVSGEVLESMISVLIGINVANYSQWLSRFQQEAGLTQFIDAGDVTSRKLAKLANFVSQSTSSQTQAKGTGGPSQNISATI
ncbi:MAG: VWA domain-containing protein [Candidatus Yanofskybacteria bacterium]|nr:VWA domain-containing protein [Candidatus Yanofskybacteria bacterium]